MQHFKLNNDGVRAILFLDTLMRDDRFHDYLKSAFPNTYWKKENEIFPREELFPTQKLGELESGIKNLRTFLKAENMPLVKFN